MFSKNIIFKNFLSASLLVLVISLITKALGLFKEVIVAKEFGLSTELDTLYLSMLVPLYIVTSVTNPLSSSFIPVFNQLEKNERKRAMTFFSSVLFWVFGGLLVLGILVFLTSNLLALALNVNDGSVDLFKKFTLVFSALLMTQGVSNYLLAFIENRKVFSFTSLGAAISSLSICAFLMFDTAVEGIAYGMLFGSIIFLFIEIIVLYQRGDIAIRFSINFPPNHYSFRNQYFFLFLASLFMGSTFVVDQIMASNLGEHYVSGLNYGFRMVSLFTGLASLALGSVALPYFSKLIVEDNKSELKGLLSRILKLIFLSSIPIIIFIFFLADFIIEFLFERGHFESNDTEMVASIFKFYTLQLPFYVGGIVLVKLISSFQKNHSILYISFANLILNVVLNLVFVKYWGIVGIAISTSCVYLFSFLLLWFKAKPLLNLSASK